MKKKTTNKHELNSDAAGSVWHSVGTLVVLYRYRVSCVTKYQFNNNYVHVALSLHRRTRTHTLRVCNSITYYSVRLLINARLCVLSRCTSVVYHTRAHTHTRLFAYAHTWWIEINARADISFGSSPPPSSPVTFEFLSILFRIIIRECVMFFLSLKNSGRIQTIAVVLYTKLIYYI